MKTHSIFLSLFDGAKQVAAADYQTATDAELMQSYKNGDSGAFNVILGRHQGGIYNFLYRYLGQHENVEEAFQEVFIRVIRSVDSYTPQAKFSTWLYTIARNYCIDLSRKGKFRKTTSLDETPGGGEESLTLEERLSDPTAGPDSHASASNLTAKLEQILGKINPDQKEVFLMREKLGLPFEEIAQVVGTSVNTVKSRMRYALLALKEEFKKLGITERS